MFARTAPVRVTVFASFAYKRLRLKGITLRDIFHLPVQACLHCIRLAMRFQRRSEYVHGLVDNVAEHAKICACEMQRQRCCQCDGGSLFHDSKDLSEHTFGRSSTSSGPALGHALTGPPDGPINYCSCTGGLQCGNVHRAVSERRQLFLHAVGDHELDFGDILGRRADAHDEEQGKGGARARHHCEHTKL